MSSPVCSVIYMLGLCFVFQSSQQVFVQVGSTVNLCLRMSGEGSSSGTKRKRRGARAQEQPAADMPLRVVEYRDDGIPHGQSMVLGDSPLLRFTFGSAEYMRYDVIKDVQLLEFRRIDWELVGQLG
ncbi:hypothetical protein HanLR1_Chr01g0023461 [Helianthus annuus]|nr:hypothetical protein HanLR1_Chr01g0023461 [Helianthus annuus]